MAHRFTQRQGQYLAFIHLYTKMNRQPPAEGDIQAYFRVSGPAVHQMIVSLAERGLIERVPYRVRSIRVLVPPEELPGLDGGPAAERPFADRYPNIAFWVRNDGWVELGYDWHTDSCARALAEGGLFASGGERDASIDDWLRVLEEGLGKFMDEEGLRPPGATDKETAPPGRT